MQDNKMFYLYFCYTLLKGKRQMYRRIRDLREDADLLQKDVAAILNCSQVCYSNYETGKRDIPTEVLVKLSEIYGTSIDYLLEVTDERNPYPKAAKRK